MGKRIHDQYSIIYLLSVVWTFGENWYNYIARKLIYWKHLRCEEMGVKQKWYYELKTKSGKYAELENILNLTALHT